MLPEICMGIVERTSLEVYCSIYEDSLEKGKQTQYKYTIISFQIPWNYQGPTCGQRSMKM